MTNRSASTDTKIRLSLSKKCVITVLQQHIITNAGQCVFSDVFNVKSQKKMKLHVYKKFKRGKEQI